MLRQGSFWLLMIAALGSPASAQIMEPKNNLHVVVNGLFDLCPKLVSGATSTGFDPAPYRLKAADGNARRWESSLTDGLVFIDFEPNERMCTVNFAGPAGAKNSIAGLSEKLMADNGYSKLDVAAPDSTPGSVYVRFNADRTRRSQFILVNSADLLTIAYSEKAN